MATSTPNRTGQEAGPEARPLTAIVNDAIKTALVAVQDYSVLAWKSIVDIFSPPFYFRDLLDQMDVIGVGSLPIIVLTGFFIGAILVLQTAAQFARFGTTALTGDAVSLALIKELGPTITALLVAGRSASGSLRRMRSLRDLRGLLRSRILVWRDALRECRVPREKRGQCQGHFDAGSHGNLLG